MGPADSTHLEGFLEGGKSASIGSIIERSAQLFPSLPAILSESGEISFSELLALVSTLGESLQRNGIGPGAGVALQVANSPQFIVGLLALARCGAVVMPIPVGLTAQELKELFADIPVEALLRNGTGNVPSVASPSVALCPLVNEFELVSLSEGNSVRRPFVPHVPDAAVIRPTSGTTGKSKGVVLSHRSVFARLEATQKNLALSPDDRILWVLPMAYHFVSSLLLYLQTGAGIVIARDHLATSIAEATQRYGGTVLFGSPSIFASLAELPSQFSLPRFRHPISTSGALSPQVATRFLERHGYLPRQVFGIIEVGLPLGHVACGHDAYAATPKGPLGHALPPYEVKISDDAGMACPSGTPGNLWVRGPGMFDAYLSPPKLREEVTVDGFFSTGDLAFQHEDGSYEIVGRKKASINYAGVKIFPEEVEGVINQFPGVTRARVYGEPHAQLGEIVVCELVLEKETHLHEPSLRRHCRKFLSTQKVPQKCKVVDAIALTHTGKVRRW